MMQSMSASPLQDLCAAGQQKLMQMQYLQAEQTLMQAEQMALGASDYDTLARLYMPLQECRRQRRQRCGEGVVRLDLVAAGPADQIAAEHVVKNYPHGQLLVAGWGTIQPAIDVRALQRRHELYVETFLAAAYPIGAGRAIAIVPTEEVRLPEPSPRSIDELIRLLPAHSIVLSDAELPAGARKGDTATFAEVMKLWEQLHAPFLAAAAMTADPLQKIAAFRKAIQVDYACELAHQNLSDIAKRLTTVHRAAVK
jgi:hypothetical protein